MHTITAITSRIAIGGAGRRQKHIAQIAQDTGMPVASQSLVHKPGQWTARIVRIAEKISSISSKKKVQPASTENEYTKRQLRDAVRLIAYRHENEKARLELKASEDAAAIYKSEEFDELFPPSLRYLRVTWEEEYDERSAVLAWQY